MRMNLPKCVVNVKRVLLELCRLSIVEREQARDLLKIEEWVCTHLLVVEGCFQGIM